ncbi:hypothetical protein Ciccas_003961 [Cichlidogyrus casuarinus]|uniref:Uncharacterized protein n=1 Tax=Cichlidogyrus casuarinus TaxID=1844966 RepID=A0ABD2QG97_9PLAT
MSHRCRPIFVLVQFASVLDQFTILINNCKNEASITNSESKINSLLKEILDFVKEMEFLSITTSMLPTIIITEFPRAESSENDQFTSIIMLLEFKFVRYYYLATTQ